MQGPHIGNSASMGGWGGGGLAGGTGPAQWISAGMLT